MSSADNSAASAERKAASFSSNTTKQIKGNKRIKPLTRDFFTLLIKLEADFNNKQYSVETLDELIQYYAKAVEYYDSIKDEISSYFIFKIQDILATKKSLKMLLEQNKAGARLSANPEAETNDSKASKKVTFEEKTEKGKDIKGNIVEESSGEEDEEDKRMTALEKMRRAAKKIDRKNRISISTMKNEKQRFVNFFYKMETQKASEKQTMKTIINEFATTSDKNDIFAKKDMDNQKERLRKRLEKRKAENLMSHTMNTYSYHVGGTTQDESHERKTTEMYGSFLEDLDGIDGSGSKQPSNIEGSERVDTEGDNSDFFKPAGEDSESKNTLPVKFLAPPTKIETSSFDDHEHSQKISPRALMSGFAKIGGISPKNINNPESIKNLRLVPGKPTKSE